MRYVIAIDGGGTKTQVWLADEAGQVVGEGQSGPASLVITPPEEAKANVYQAVEQALATLPPEAKVEKAFMGLAGVDIPIEVEKAQQIFAPIFTEKHIPDFTVVNDVEIALASGTSINNGIALISGTGSNCFGKNAAGQKARTSGLDYILADQGSGYSLGWHALRAAVKSYDGRAPKSILEALICQHFQVAEIPELKLKVYHPPLTKTQTAELAQLAEVALNQGDKVAQRLFDELVTELVEMVVAVATRLTMTDVPVECVMVGGMFRVPYVTDRLTEALKQRLPQLTLVKPAKPPVAGALRLALERLR